MFKIVTKTVYTCINVSNVLKTTKVFCAWNINKNSEKTQKEKIMTKIILIHIGTWLLLSVFLNKTLFI